MTDTPTWEKITDGSGEYLDRMRVPGGWLYRTAMFSETEAIGVAMTFVPDAPIEHRSR